MDENNTRSRPGLSRPTIRDVARLAGVSKYRTGLRDGDIVVSVAGTRTPTVSAMASAAMQAASSGATRISGRVVRGDASYAVVLELPSRRVPE